MIGHLCLIFTGFAGCSVSLKALANDNWPLYFVGMIISGGAITAIGLALGARL